MERRIEDLEDKLTSAQDESEDARGQVDRLSKLIEDQKKQLEMQQRQ